MLREEINASSFVTLRAEALQLREQVGRQEEVLADIGHLLEFAMDNDMDDEVVELYFEKALIHQHSYMEAKNGVDLEKMRETINMAKVYVQEKGLKKWESRVARYLGRIADYDKKYEEAILYFDEAISKAELDPKYEGNRAMAYEYKGFMVVDELRVSDTDTAVEKALSLYQDYDERDEGRELKTKDYTTWAIWRSAVLINLCSALIDLGKKDEYLQRIEEWLIEAEKNFVVPEGVQTWADFGFRKNEIKRIREMLHD